MKGLMSYAVWVINNNNKIKFSVNYKGICTYSFNTCLFIPYLASALFYFFKNVYFWREREHKPWRGRERGRERIPSRLHAVSTEPSMGLKLTNCEIMT